VDIATITGSTISALDGPSRAPGMLLAHYAPKARVELCNSISEAHDRFGQLKDDLVSVELLHYEDLETYALSLYDNLRTADINGTEVVIAVLPPDEGLGTAIRDRLSKASASN
jgi:L-threonylcarbamoyladenylate synthase